MKLVIGLRSFSRFPFTIPDFSNIRPRVLQWWKHSHNVATCGLSVVSSRPCLERFFLRVLRFSRLFKNQDYQISIDLKRASTFIGLLWIKLPSASSLVNDYIDSKFS